MSRLTEEMVIARSKQSDLGLIKKLNCWGSDLTDVSIIRRMHGVEVLALSVNKIATLQPFEDCNKLQELYLRKNNIEDINEIAYLQNLPVLKYLWLEENPCCERAGPNYRLIVLRALPNLKKLDNIDVSEEEVEEASRLTLGTSAQDEESYDDGYDQQRRQQQQQHQPQQPSQQQQQYHHQPQQSSSNHNSSPMREEQVHPPSPTKYNSIPKEHRMSYHHQNDRSPGSDQESPYAGYRERTAPLPPSISTQSMKEYYQSDRQAYPAHYRHSQNDLTEWEEHQQQHQPNRSQYGSTAQLHHQQNRRIGGGGVDRELNDRYRNGNARENGDWDELERGRPRRSVDGRHNSDSASTVMSHYSSCHRRPINRSSNLLSAALCLVKELDYPSLEVVEHAVRCRIDELAQE